MHRTHKCGQLNQSFINQNVKVCGWVNSIRDHGGVIFIDLRDDSGIIQLTLRNEEILGISKECTISAQGIVKERAEDSINIKLPTGFVEVKVNEIEILGKCKNLPFEIDSSENVKEELRFKYRFLDLRNKVNHEKIVIRSEIIHFLRNKMKDLGFIEVQTPLLSSSSPEGARDYLVPSRKHKGKFYALPQAPQIFKQLLMVCGFDKYYQIAPCFRDEDSRADRAPGEFYQLDFEMAYAEQEDVLEIAEKILKELFIKFSNEERVTKNKFPRIPYKESIEKYGTDKPDLRNPLIINDVSSIFLNSGFMPFDGKIVKTLCISNLILDRDGNFVDINNLSRKFFDTLNKFSIEIGMKGLGYVKIDKNMSLTGPIEKFIPKDKMGEFLNLSKACPESVIFFIADDKKNAPLFAGKIRTELANKLNLIDCNKFEFCYITDFHMYETDEETGNIVFTHNPFSMPQGGLDALSIKNPLEILAHQYDVVCNGIELSSGAVRNHDPQIMLKAFEIAGYKEEDIISKFSALYNAFFYGAPPHAGMAPGIDRIVMLLTGAQNIRDVIAFPMNSNAQDVLLGAPSYVSEEQLRDIHIKIRE